MPLFRAMRAWLLKNTQVHMELPSESGGSNITQYLIDVDTVSTFSSTALVTFTVDSDEVRPRRARQTITAE